MIAAYLYLSSKGFEYKNGSFELVSKAYALENNDISSNEDVLFANPISDRVAINLPEKTTIGKDEAPVTIYEFSSLGCMHCADFHLNTLSKLQEEYIEKGLVRIVFVHFPLDKGSMQAAMLSECLEGEHKSAFLSKAFLKQREWALSAEPKTTLAGYATAEGLSLKDVNSCLKNDDVAKEILANRQEAIEKLKIEGTPAFLIDSAKKREIIYGVPETKKLKNYLDQRLAEEIQ